MSVSAERGLLKACEIAYLEELFSQEPLMIPVFPESVPAMSPHEQIPLFKAVRSAQYGFRRIDALTSWLFPGPEHDTAHPLVQYRNFWKEKAVMSCSPAVEVTNDPPPLSTIPMVKTTVDVGIYEYYHILELHRNWVTKRASRLYGNSILQKWYSFEDVYDLCSMGLMRAAARYDPAFDVPFLAFSALPMFGSVFDELRVVSPISRGVFDRIKAIEQKNIEFELGHGRTPSSQELSELTGLTPLQMDTAWKNYAMNFPQSLTAPHPQTETEGDGSQTPAEVVAADQSFEPERRYLQSEEQYELIQRFRTLPDRLQLLLSLYYDQEMTGVEISIKLGVSEARISQLHRRALNMLRPYFPDIKASRPDPLVTVHVQKGFGARLRQIRQARGISTSELSRRLRWNKSIHGYISTLELELRQNFEQWRIREIMKALSLTPEEEQGLRELMYKNKVS